MRFFVLLFSLLVLGGCQKEERQVLAEDSGDITSAQKIDLLSKAYGVIKAHEANATIQFRSDDKFTVSEAKWSLEAVANVTFAQRISESDKINSKQFSFTIPKSNGLISETGLANAYFEIHDKIVEHYNDISSENKYVYNVYLSISESSSTSVQFNGITQISESSSALTTDCNTVFAEGSAHKFGFNSALDCENEENLQAEEAWDLQLKALIDEGTHIPSPYPNAPYFVGFVTPFAVENEFLPFIDYEVPNSDFDGYRDYLLYVYEPSVNDPEDLCINSDDMNWYLCNYYD